MNSKSKGILLMKEYLEKASGAGSTSELVDLDEKYKAMLADVDEDGLMELHQAFSVYARSIMQAEDNSMFVDTDKWLERAERARKLWMRLIKDDAEKEFQMGDVDEEFFREFIDKIG